MRMRKSIRIFIWFLAGLISLSLFSHFALAQNLLSPIVETATENLPSPAVATLPTSSQYTTNNLQTNSAQLSPAHSLSFGDLLSLFSSDSAVLASQSAAIIDPLQTVKNEQNNAFITPEKITAFLKELGISSSQSQKALEEFFKQQNTHPPQTIDDQLISASSLIEAVQSYNTPAPTYTPKTQAYLESLTPTPFPSTNYELPTTNFLSPYLSPAEALAEVGTPPPSPSYPSTDYPSTTLRAGELSTKNSYTIALLGDSMTDTLGPDFPYLKNLLNKSYPGRSFTILNYGFASTDMESGLSRLTNTTNYLGKVYAPLLSYLPDILVVESFGYNHWSGELSDLNRQWITIAHIIDAVRAQSPETQIILAATIAPNPFIFGDGVLNWPDYLKWDATIITKAYIQNMINFATSQYYPLADAYHPSLGPDGHGQRRFINSGDNIHPSDEGKLLYAQKVLEAIKNNNILR